MNFEALLYHTVVRCHLSKHPGSGARTIHNPSSWGALSPEASHFLFIRRNKTFHLLAIYHFHGYYSLAYMTATYFLFVFGLLQC